MSRRAFSMIEVLIVCALLTFGFLALLTVYTSNLRNATLTRDHLLASLLCETIFAEIREHRYGTPPPLSWGDQLTHTPAVQSIPVWVQGRPVETTFEVLITPAASGNGSFFNASKTNSTDEIWCRIRWVEGTEDRGARAEKKFEFTMDVRRDGNLVVPTN